MKRICVAILVLVVSVSLASCTNSVKKSSAETESTSVTSVETTQAEITTEEETTRAEPVTEEEITQSEVIEDTGSYEQVTVYQPQLRTCPECGGSCGHFETTFDGFGNPIDQWRPCGTCGGSGQYYY